MTMTVGIDISKHWLDVACFPDAAAGGETRFGNTEAGRAELLAWLDAVEARGGRSGATARVRVVFEATGAYHRGLAEALERAGRGFCKVNPRRSRRFAQAVGKLAKTDRIDAAMLARMGQVLDLKADRPRGEKQSEISALSGARQALIKDRNALLARLGTAAHPLVRDQLARRVAAVKADIAEIDAALATLIRQDEALRARAAILVSIPGLGAVTAATMLAAMPELGTMDNRQAAALAGLAPVTRSSGQWRGHAFIGGGRAGLRRALFMPALVASRFNRDLRETYERLKAAGKPKKLALVAVMRKLIVLANTLLRQNRKWEPRPA